MIRVFNCAAILMVLGLFLAPCQLLAQQAVSGGRQADFMGVKGDAGKFFSQIRLYCDFIGNGF